jgi:L-erythro-3,5-diaminohexanoate dehydrogenase
MPIPPRPTRWGSHRVLEPLGVLPQAAWKIDSTPCALDTEIVCDVEALNIDSSSFRQIVQACDRDPHRVAEHIVANVLERGKQHNAVTGSGGMFVGRVREIGTGMRASCDLAVGDRIASLVSLTLTPLAIERVLRIDMDTGRLWVDGTAVLFESAPYARLPDDIPDDTALAVLDVCGAPAQVYRLAQPGQTVLVIGADGKSGLLVCARARERVGLAGRVVGVLPDRSTDGARLLEKEGYVDVLVECDARDALATHGAAANVIPQLADLTVNAVNVTGTEMSSILCTRDGGTVYFFSTCTSFTAAMLGAEGVGKDVTMIIGNGYAPGHAHLALQTLRDRPALKEYFMKRYGSR